MRIGLNGRELEVGQAFANIDTSITSAAYSPEGRQILSTQGSVVQLDKGPQLDEFFLTFEQLGTASNVYVEATPPPPATPADQPRGPELGVRDLCRDQRHHGAPDGHTGEQRIGQQHL